MISLSLSDCVGWTFAIISSAFYIYQLGKYVGMCETARACGVDIDAITGR
jgi:hypothetical protein